MFLGVCLLICVTATVQGQETRVTIQVEKTNIAFKMPDNNFQFTKEKDNRTWHHLTSGLALVLRCSKHKIDVYNRSRFLTMFTENMKKNMENRGAKVYFQKEIENIPVPNKTGSRPNGLIIQEENQITVVYIFSYKQYIFNIMVIYNGTMENPYKLQNFIEQIPQGGQDFIKSFVYVE